MKKTLSAYFSSKFKDAISRLYADAELDVDVTIPWVLQHPSDDLEGDLMRLFCRIVEEPAPPAVDIVQQKKISTFESIRGNYQFNKSHPD